MNETPLWASESLGANQQKALKFHEFYLCIRL
jgi:hypothetical protein